MELKVSCPISFNEHKCVKCQACFRKCHAIGVDAISFDGRIKLNEGKCIGCGQCTIVCPVDAMTEKKQVAHVSGLLSDKRGKFVVAQIAPAVRVSLSEVFGGVPGKPLTKQIVSALKQMGFDDVFDVAFSADIASVEEAVELLEAKKEGKLLFSLCCSSWMEHVNQSFPGYFQNISSLKSPQIISGTLIKAFYAKEKGIDPEKMVVVSIMPCTSKKSEAMLSYSSFEGIPEVDYVLTTRELVELLAEKRIDLNELKEAEFSSLFGDAAGAGVIFGKTGGVAEAVARNACALLDEKFCGINFKDNGFWKSATLEIGGIEYEFGVVHGLENANKLMHMVSDGTVKLDFLEVMACPGGCIGGGGQPKSKNQKVLDYRELGLEKIDEEIASHRTSLESPGVQMVYERFFGEPGSQKARDLLRWK